MARPTEVSLFQSSSVRFSYMAAYDAVMTQWPAPYEELNVPTRFGLTHVVANGAPDAPTIVLLPPGGTYAPMWIRNVAALSTRLRTYAVDIVGELNKSVPIRPIRREAEVAQWMTDLLDGLGVQTANIMGNSNGGFYALQVALSIPHRVDKVILIDPAATFLQMWAWWLKLMIPAHMIAPLIRSEPMILRAYSWLWQDFPIDPHQAELRRLSKVSGARYRPSINSAVPRVFSDRELRSVQPPVLLLYGDHEVIYDTKRAIERASRLVLQLTAEIVPNANHSPQYTAPNFVNDRVLSFLGSQGGCSPRVTFKSESG